MISEKKAREITNFCLGDARFLVKQGIHLLPRRFHKSW